MPFKASLRELLRGPVEARQSRPALKDDSNCLLALFHGDWTVPQAQQALSTWMTLAMLLAGTQRTLLSYFRSADNSTSLIDGVGWAGLCLEVYGALLASVAIMSSISLPASGTLSRSKSYHSGFFECLGLKGPQATAILDHLTLACGCIVIAGALCELISLAAYITLSQKGPVSFTVGVTLAACGLITLSAAAWGYLHGSKTQNHVDETEREVECIPRLSNKPSSFLMPPGTRNDGQTLEINAFSTSPYCYK